MPKQITASSILPRLLRLRDAPAYCGMDRNRYNREVRPHLREIRIGKQGVAFDRLEIDAWLDNYIACNGRPCRIRKEGGMTWDENASRVSSSATASGTSTSSSKVGVFAAALAQLNSRKPNAS